jgi:hypothetical protein
MNSSLSRTCLVTASLAVASCSQGGDDASTPTDRVSIHVAPLSLDDISNIAYTVTVRNHDTPPKVVWSKALESADYGSAHGDLAYVGPCDAGSSPNTVEVLIDRMEDGDGATVAADTWRDPGPLVRSFACLPNADVPVELNVVVARSAHQGFFDVAVDFADIFCSAKLDCVDDLLTKPGGGRGDAVVVALTCTSGQGETTWLHQDDIVLTCSDDTVVRTSPLRGPGNIGGASPYIFERATYRGSEDYPELDKCYWNTAIGIDDAAIPAGVDCTLTGRASASAAAWAEGVSPIGWTWPSITWNVKVVDDGVMACGQHALDVADSGVATGYPSGTTQYAYSMQCSGDPTPVANGFGCSGTVAGLSDSAVFAATPEGVVVTVGGRATAPMALPEGASLEGCCLDPCCSEP